MNQTTSGSSTTEEPDVWDDVVDAPGVRIASIMERRSASLGMSEEGESFVRREAIGSVLLTRSTFLIHWNIPSLSSVDGLVSSSRSHSDFWWAKGSAVDAAASLWLAAKLESLTSLWEDELTVVGRAVEPLPVDDPPPM